MTLPRLGQALHVHLLLLANPLFYLSYLDGEHLAQNKLTKEELIRESMNSPKKIDITVDIRIPRSAEQFDPNKHKYKCSCCGKGFSGQQKHNFQKSNSPLFQANDGFLPWCKECTDRYFGPGSL
ncbi:hypothetical protein [Acidovorax sp. BLS4]|uniref:hypothetical protein n=1 Tax=Acidovorax sp. BLS4 TaxID=3273430 RepID=UPI00294386C5|nr:hypothetical protein [Paracidovorax avenae]WOI45571.1 hypothetical protein R1Z03_24405 [Paracidovorax avenae]